jgi:ribosomal protein L37AE/L43A
MSENDAKETPPQAEPEVEELQDPYKIEEARSSRSRCRTCKRKIDKGLLRIGVLLEGPYGTGYLWHHLTCAAKRRFEDVEEAYAAEAWEKGAVEPPSLESLAKLREKAEEQKKNKKELPYAERAPSGRAKCKHCGETIEKDAFRVVLGRDVQFGNQIRTGPINVHPSCVPAELMAEDCETEIEGFEDALKANSSGLTTPELEECLAAIGELE